MLSLINLEPKECNMSALQEQPKPILGEYIPQVYVPELDVSKLSGAMNKTWFYNQLIDEEILLKPSKYTSPPLTAEKSS